MNFHMQCQEVLPTQAGATAVGNVAHGVQATGATAANAAQAVAGRRRLHDAVVHIPLTPSHLHNARKKSHT